MEPFMRVVISVDKYLILISSGARRKLAKIVRRTAFSVQLSSSWPGWLSDQDYLRMRLAKVLEWKL